MLTVVSVEFDHDWSKKAERFSEFSDELISSETFDSVPIVEHTPVFSYSLSGRSHFDDLANRIGSQEAIIFLSDICSYSFVAIQSAAKLDTRASLVSTYESFSSLSSCPLVRGQSVSADGSINLVDGDILAISMLPYGILDVETDEPNPAVIEVVGKVATGSGPIYAYRILDRKLYFESVCSDWPIYLLDGSEIDINAACDHYRNDELTEYLLSVKIPFGTLNDGHQDDLYLVSYRKNFWLPDDSSLAFIA